MGLQPISRVYEGPAVNVRAAAMACNLSDTEAKTLAMFCVREGYSVSDAGSGACRERTGMDIGVYGARKWPHAGTGHAERR